MPDGQRADDPVYLSGSGYDMDDGTLSGPALRWTSDIQGFLGSGSPLRVKMIPGNHTITLTATSSDGKSVHTRKKIVIGDKPPVVELHVEALNNSPATCW